MSSIENNTCDVLVVESHIGDDCRIVDSSLMEYQPIVPYNFKKRTCNGRDPRDGVFMCYSHKVIKSVWNLTLNPDPFNTNENFKIYNNDKTDLSVNIIRRVQCRDKFIQMIIGKIVNEQFPYMDVTWMQQYIISFVRWECSEDMFTNIKYILRNRLDYM
jgi:hypothetical protein